MGLPSVDTFFADAVDAYRVKLERAAQHLYDPAPDPLPHQQPDTSMLLPSMLGIKTEAEMLLDEHRAQLQEEYGGFQGELADGFEREEEDEDDEEEEEEAEYLQGEADGLVGSGWRRVRGDHAGVFAACFWIGPSQCAPVQHTLLAARPGVNGPCRRRASSWSSPTRRGRRPTTSTASGLRTRAPAPASASRR